MSETYNLPDGFYFGLFFTGTQVRHENSFSEVSGIKASLDVEEVKEGGDNRFTYKVPTRGKYENIILKRGLMLKDSSILKWCMETILGKTNKIETKDISVRLMDTNGNSLMDWNFKDAWPVSWSVSNLDTTNPEIMIETLEFAYTYFTTEQK